MSRPPGEPAAPWAVPAAMAVMVAVWGSTWVVVATGLDDLPPLTAAAVRFVLAAALMVLIGPRLARKEGGARPWLGLAIVQGLGNFAWPYAMTYRAQEVLPSGLVAVLWTTFPVFTALTAPWLVPGERFRPRQWIALGLAMAGVARLFDQDVRAFGDEHLQAAAWLLTGPLVSALATGWIKRTGSHVSSAHLNRDGLVVAAVVLVTAGWCLEGAREQTWSAAAIGSVAYLAVMGTVVTFGLYFWAVRRAPVWQLSLIALMTPVLALVLGSQVRGEAITASMQQGLALILLGVVGVIWGDRRSKPRAGASS